MPKKFHEFKIMFTNSKNAHTFKNNHVFKNVYVDLKNVCEFEEHSQIQKILAVN